MGISCCCGGNAGASRASCLARAVYIPITVGDADTASAKQATDVSWIVYTRNHSCGKACGNAAKRSIAYQTADTVLTTHATCGVAVANVETILTYQTADIGAVLAAYDIARSVTVADAATAADAYPHQPADTQPATRYAACSEAVTKATTGSIKFTHQTAHRARPGHASRSVTAAYYGAEAGTCEATNGTITGYIGAHQSHVFKYCIGVRNAKQSHVVR